MADEHPVLPANMYRKTVSFAEYVDEIYTGEQEYEEDNVAKTVYRIGEGRSIVVNFELQDNQAKNLPSHAEKDPTTLPSTPSNLPSSQVVSIDENKLQSDTKTIPDSLNKVVEVLNDFLAPILPWVNSCTDRICHDDESDSDESPVAVEPPQGKATIIQYLPSSPSKIGSHGSAFQPVRNVSQMPDSIVQNRLPEYLRETNRPNKPYRRKDGERDDASTITTQHSAFADDDRVLVVPPIMHHTLPTYNI